MNKTEKLRSYGQSIWYDNIQRRLLKNGELRGMIDRHEIFGVTSNPSIFQNAIAKSTDYDADLKSMVWSGWTADQIFWELAIEDIRRAADLFRGLYEETNGGDGYVSLEVNPLLAKDSMKTYEEALQLWQRVDRENLMIKIPATKEGIPAVRKSIAAGLNVNVTLIFSIDRYQEVINAYLSGLEDRLAQGKQIDNIASVASFFVSRVDTKVDKLLEQKIAAGINDAKALQGKAAIANVKMAYEVFKKSFTSERWQKLSEQGARLQRPLWASTSTKNPDYRDVIYVEELIGADTVNTVPPQTLTAFLDHGNINETIEQGLNEAKDQIQMLEALGISMGAITAELETEGVDAFITAFMGLLDSIKEKVDKITLELGPIKDDVKNTVELLHNQNAVKRLYDVDATLWTTDLTGQAEIKKRCNWLNAPWKKCDVEGCYTELQNYCKEKGFTDAVLLGMGGSSLAPEVMRQINGVTKTDKFNGLDLVILDSTDPGQVKEVRQKIEIGKTLFIVSSKSGGTAEVNAYLDYFWKETVNGVGKKAGDHFIAITDPGTNLEVNAKEKGFWRIYPGDPMVGGRNSALTAFGLVPAALIGMDVEKLLRNAESIAEKCLPEVPTGANPGAVLGAILGAAWKQGRDKLTIVTDAEWESFGSWLEQLIAESSGKQGKGIIPVANEPALEASRYQKDRIFVYLNSTNSKSIFIENIRKAGHPAIEILVRDSYDLGGQFYLWEVATAIACSIMGVNSFDQPDVQDNKTRTVSKINDFRKNGKFQEDLPALDLPYAKIYVDAKLIDLKNPSLHDLLIDYLKKVIKPGDYVAINAYMPRNQKNIEELTRLRESILSEVSVATTLGFGPRFLHSTGQLHKGGPDSGVFIQITADVAEDIEIPNEGMTFGVLEKAQYLGDFEALQARNRRLIRIHMNQPDHQRLIK
jgi:transaldolase/glucose-6-phosphate isomerase